MVATERSTCVGFEEADGSYPRLSLMSFPLKLTTLEKPDASLYSQASQVSSSPVKRACKPYTHKYNVLDRFKVSGK